MTKTNIPWRIVDDLDNAIADRNIMLRFLEQEAIKLKNKELSKVEKEIGEYDNWKKRLAKNKRYQKALEDTYTNQNYYQCEAIINLMPDDEKMKKAYTKFIDSNLEKLYSRWNAVGSIGATQMMLVYHPIADIRMAGLELLIAHNIGDGSSKDLTSKMCEMTNCRFIVTEYVDQELHGYRQADPYCPAHGDMIYNNALKEELREKWNNYVKFLK